MTSTSVPRYAIYYTPQPGTPLEQFGKAWLSRTNGAAAAAKITTSRIDPARISAITESSRRYGLHGTLKPPFELNPATTLDALLGAARVFARSVAPVEIPALELAEIGKFIALTPVSQSAALEKLSGLFHGLPGARVWRRTLAHVSQTGADPAQLIDLAHSLEKGEPLAA